MSNEIIQVKPYLRNTVDSIISLIRNSLNLMLTAEVDEVLEEIKVTQIDSIITIYIKIHPNYKSVVFGRQFCNIQAIRKLISNASGRDNVFYKLVTEE
nr:MAG TPA: hypothetical protein [Bacteriophage sp.]